MLKAAWKIVKRKLADRELSLCGYCRRPYSDRSFIPVGTALTDQQFSEVVSHGMCRLCKFRALEADKAEAAK